MNRTLLFCIALAAVAVIYFTVGAGLTSVMSAEKVIKKYECKCLLGQQVKQSLTLFTPEARGHLLLRNILYLECREYDIQLIKTRSCKSLDLTDVAGAGT